MTVELATLADRLAGLPRADLDEARDLLGAGALGLPSIAQRQLAAAYLELLDAIAEGADPHLACQVLADALSERRVPDARVVPLRERLAALRSLERSNR